ASGSQPGTLPPLAGTPSLHGGGRVAGAEGRRAEGTRHMSSAPPRRLHPLLRGTWLRLCDGIFRRGRDRIDNRFAGGVEETRCRGHRGGVQGGVLKLGAARTPIRLSESSDNTPPALER